MQWHGVWLLRILVHCGHAHDARFIELPASLYTSMTVCAVRRHRQSVCHKPYDTNQCVTLLAKPSSRAQADARRSSGAYSQEQ